LRHPLKRARKARQVIRVHAAYVAGDVREKVEEGGQDGMNGGVNIGH